MRKVFLIALVMSCMLSCKPEGGEEGKMSTTFDADKWSIKKGQDYPYREQMYRDIAYNDTVRSLSKSEIMALLGEPDRIQEGHLYYQVSQTRIGFWPLHTRSLVIKITDDDSIEWIKIHE